MKLSEKGIETVFTALLKTIEERDLAFGKNSRDVFKKHIEALEFEPDDFDGGCFQNGKDHFVFLTVEEAKEFLIAFQDLIDLHEDGYIKITDFGFDTFDLVKKRIEQAEGKG